MAATIVRKFSNPFDNANLLDEGGLLYIANDYATNGSETYANGDGSNEDAIINSISAHNFDNVGYFIDAQISHTLENEKVKESDACGHEEIDNSVDLIPTLTATLQEIGDIDLFATMIGQSVQTIAGAPLVGEVITKTFSAYTVFGKVTDAKEWDAGTTTITTVTGSVDGLLVVSTDYTVETDDDGNVGIELVSGGAITVLDQDFVVVFAATVKDKKQIVYKAGTRSMPYLLLRFCECDKIDESRGRNHYIVKARVSTETVMEFINESRNDFTGATITFTCAKDGNYAMSQINL